MTGEELSEASELALRAELELVLSEPEFVRSPVMSKLLTFLVERRISDPAHPPKAYEVAVDALERPEDFDVQSDSYPRVQVGRLRKMLEKHYAQREVEPLIVIPKGNYGLVFRPLPDSEMEHAGLKAGLDASEANADPNSKGAASWYRNNSKLRIAALVGILLLVGAWMGSRIIGDQEAKPDINAEAIRMPPMLFIEEVELGAGSEANDQANFLQAFWEVSLGGFSTIRLSSEEDGGTFSQKRALTYRLKSTISEAGGQRRVTATVISVRNKEIIWQKVIPWPQDQKMSDIFGPVAALLGDSTGPIARDAKEQLRDVEKIGYACRLKYDEFRSFRTAKLAEDVDACIAASLDENPNDILMLDAASLMAHLEDPSLGRTGSLEEGRKFSTLAINQSSESALSNFAVARSAFFARDCQQLRFYLDRATELNPFSAEIYGYGAGYLSGCRDPAAVQYAEWAVKLGADNSPMPYLVLVVDRYQAGDAAATLEIARSQPPSNLGFARPYHDFAMVLASTINGNVAEARRHWQAVMEKYGRNSRFNDEQILNGLIADPEIRADIYKDLKVKGVIG